MLPRYCVAFESIVEVDVPPAEVWAAVENPEWLVESSRWVERITGDRDGLRAGSTVVVVLATPLPFSLTVELLVDVCRPPEMVCVWVGGDLEGFATLCLGNRGAGTVGEVSWSLEMTQPAMRAMALLSGPLLRWGHYRVAGATIAAFIGELGRRSGQDQSGLR
jgi:hypothetical protein